MLKRCDLEGRIQQAREMYVLLRQLEFGHLDIPVLQPTPFTLKCHGLGDAEPFEQWFDRAVVHIPQQWLS